MAAPEMGLVINNITGKNAYISNGLTAGRQQKAVFFLQSYGKVIEMQKQRSPSKSVDLKGDDDQKYLISPEASLWGVLLYFHELPLIVTKTHG